MVNHLQFIAPLVTRLWDQHSSGDKSAQNLGHWRPQWSQKAMLYSTNGLNTAAEDRH